MHLLPSSMGLQTIYRIRPVVLVVMWFLFVTSVLQAGGELRRPFQGIRNLGMGNVGVAMSHDENALFYNPAGLAAVDTTIVSIPFVNEVSKDTLSLTSQVAKLGSDSTTADTVALALGKQIHYRNMTALNVIIPFGSLMTFGAAAGLETTIDLSASNPVGIQFNYGMRLDQIYNIGGGFNLGRGRWLIGVNVEKYKRCDYPVKTVAMSTLLNSSNIASDVGFCKTDLMRDGQTYGFGFQNRMSSFSTLRMVCGFAKLGDERVMVMGTQKGRDTKENVMRNFGCAHPEGYRKALRLMKLAGKFELPIITIIDTAGAFPGIGAEERHIAKAIAVNLREMMTLKVPVIAVVIGEGGSGGALGIGVADRVLILENAYYSVISPEGCASILWKDRAAAPDAADALKITSEHLKKFGLVDEIIPEPLGGAHNDPEATAATLKKHLLKHLKVLKRMPLKQRLDERYNKFRDHGQFEEEPLPKAAH